MGDQALTSGPLPEPFLRTSTDAACASLTSNQKTSIRTRFVTAKSTEEAEEVNQVNVLHEL